MALSAGFCVVVVVVVVDVVVVVVFVVVLEVVVDLVVLQARDGNFIQLSFQIRHFYLHYLTQFQTVIVLA